MKSTSLKAFLFLCFITVASFALLLMPNDVCARAGGGGGKGGAAGGIVALFMLPLLLIYYTAFSYVVANKYRQSKTLLEKLKLKDNVWNPDVIKHRIDMTFYKIQEAWRERDQSIAADYMSETLLKKHQMQTDQMKRQGRINILDKVNLIKSVVVQVSDFKDDSKDCLWAYVKGSMVDYTIDEKSKEVLEGKPKQSEKFTELWKFIRHPQNGWVLDLIEQEAKIAEIADFESFSEELNEKEIHPLFEKFGKAASFLEWTVKKDNDDVPEMKSPVVALLFGLILPWVLVAFVLLSVNLDKFK